jgi:hypothetical protein
MYFLLRNIGFERVALALVDMKKSPCEKNDDNFHFEWRGEKKSKIFFQVSANKQLNFWLSEDM